jgi:hypothetical protein
MYAHALATIALCEAYGMTSDRAVGYAAVLERAMAFLRTVAVPALGASTGTAAHDLYYWYYASQVTHNQPGPDWDAWNRKMRGDSRLRLRNAALPVVCRLGIL